MATTKICVLGFEDYPMLSGESSLGHTGGESVQHLLLARAWRDLGIEVSIIVHDCGQPPVVDFDGIRAVAAFRVNAGTPGVRFFQRIASVVRTMDRIDADVYYQSPSSAFTGVAAWYAKRRGKRCIVRIASDLGCIPGQQLMRYWRDRRIYDYGLRNASMIAAQTQHQRHLLQQNYGLHSEVVNMLVEIPETPASRAPDIAKDIAQDIDVLWVGNLRPVKQPQHVFELARRLPRYRFVIAGGPLPRQQQYFDRMMSEGSELPNVSLLGAVNYQDIGALFERARVHLNTSSAEGFPNTFLQAWIRSVPVVSCFDPDRLIERRALGRSCSDMDGLASAIDELLRDPLQRADIGRRARAFVASEFSPRQIAARYLELLDSGARDAGIAADAGLASGPLGDRLGDRLDDRPL